MPLCPVCGSNVPQGRLTAHVNACLDGRGPAALREELPPPLCMLAGEAALARLDTRRKLHGSPCISAPAGNVSGLLYVHLRDVRTSAGAFDLFVSLAFDGQVYRAKIPSGRSSANLTSAAEVMFSVVEYCASSPLTVQLHALPATQGRKSPVCCCKGAVDIASSGDANVSFSREGEPLPPHALLLCESRVPLSSALHAAATAAEAKLGLQHRRAIEAARTVSRADEADADALLSAPTVSAYASLTSPRRWWEDASHTSRAGDSGDSARSAGSVASRRSSGASAGSNDDNASGAGEHDGAAGGGSAHRDAGRGGGGFGFRVSNGRSDACALSAGPTHSAVPSAAGSAAASASASPSAPAARVPSSPSLDRGAAQRRLAVPVDPPRRSPAASPLRRASAHDESSGASRAASDPHAGSSSTAGDRDRDHLTLSEVLLALANEDHRGGLPAERPVDAALSSRLAPTSSARSLSPSIRVGPLSGASPGRAGDWAAGETPSSVVDRDRTLAAARALGWAPLPKHGSSSADAAAAPAAPNTGHAMASSAAAASGPPRLPFAFHFQHGLDQAGTLLPNADPLSGADRTVMGTRRAVLHMSIPPADTLAALHAERKAAPDDASEAPSQSRRLSCLAAALSSLCRRGSSRKRLSSKRIAESFGAGGGTAEVTLDLLYVAASDLAPPQAFPSAASTSASTARTSAAAAAHASETPAASVAVVAAKVSDGVALALPSSPACGLHRAAAAGAAPLLAAGMHATDRLWLLARTPAVPPSLVLQRKNEAVDAASVASLSKPHSRTSTSLNVAGFQFGGLSVLDVAVLNGQRNIVGLLLERGSTLAAFSPRVSPGTHWGSLHYAALCPDERVAAVLLAGHCALMAAAGRSLPRAPALLNALLREGCDDSAQAHHAHPSLRGTGGWWRGIPFALQRGTFAARSHSETTRYVAGVRSLLVDWCKEDEAAAAPLSVSSVAAARTPAASTASRAPGAAPGSVTALQGRPAAAAAAEAALASDEKEPDSDSEAESGSGSGSDGKGDGDGVGTGAGAATDRNGDGTAAAAVATSASDVATDSSSLTSSSVFAAIQRLESPTARAMATILLTTARGTVHLHGGAAVGGAHGPENAGGSLSAAAEAAPGSASTLTRHFALHAPSQPHAVPSEQALAAGAAVMPLTVFGWRPASGRSAVVDIPDAGGNTALALACAAGHSKTVEMLLELQACRGAANAAGDTPLMHSLRAHRPDIALQLLLWPDKPSFTAGRSIGIRIGASIASAAAATPSGLPASASAGRPLSMVATVTLHAHAREEGTAPATGAFASFMQRLQRRGGAAGGAAAQHHHHHHDVGLPAAAVRSRHELTVDNVAKRVGPARPAAVSSLAGETALLLAARALPWQRDTTSAGSFLADSAVSRGKPEAAQLQLEAQLLDVISLLETAGASASIPSKTLTPTINAALPVAASPAAAPVARGLPTARSLALLASAAAVASSSGAGAAAVTPLAGASEPPSSTAAADPIAAHNALLLEIEGEAALHAAAKRGSVAGVRALCRLDDDALFAALHASSRRVSTVAASLAAAGLPSPRESADLPAAVDPAVLVALGWRQHRARRASASMSMSGSPLDEAASELEDMLRLPAVNVRVRDAAGRTPRECALIAAAAGVDGADAVADLLEKLELLQPTTVRSGRRGSIVAAAGPGGTGRRGSITGSDGSSRSPAIAGRRLSGLDTSWLLALPGDAAASPPGLSPYEDAETRAGFAADAEDADATAAYLETNAALLPAGKSSSATPSAIGARRPSTAAAAGDDDDQANEE